MRWGYPVATVVAPFAVWIFLIGMVDALIPAPELGRSAFDADICIGPAAPNGEILDIHALCGEFLPQPAFGARDMSGRLELITPAALIVLAGAAATIWSLYAVFWAPRTGNETMRQRTLTRRALYMAAPAGLLVFVALANRMGVQTTGFIDLFLIGVREILAERLIFLAESLGRMPSAELGLSEIDRALIFLFRDPDAVGTAAGVTSVDLLSAARRLGYFFGYLGAGLSIVACAVLAAPSRDETVEDLRWRFSALQKTIVLGSVIFVLSVALMRGATHWGPRLLNDDVAPHLLAAASSTVAMWGAVGSAVLVAAATPSMIGLSQAIDAAARGETAVGPKASAQDVEKWRETHGLLLTARGSILTVLALIAPIATGPLLEATTSLGG